MGLKKAVLIVGGTSDIGQAICRRFSQSTLPLIMTYQKNRKVALSVKKSLKQEGRHCEVLRCDISHKKSIKTLFSRIRLLGFRVHVLVINAGVKDDKLAVQMDAHSWRSVMRVNVDGAFHCIQACLPGMIAKKSGAIVNVSSIAAISGQVGQANYCASKGAVISLTRSLARELGPKNIRVNCVAPGYVESGMIQELKADPDLSDYFNGIISTMCSLRRVGEPDEIANVVFFLASKQSSYINGQTIIADGGILM